MRSIVGIGRWSPTVLRPGFALAFPVYGAAMSVARSRLAVVVLAAGAGARFSDQPAGKLLAPLDGRPVLAHVLEAVRTFAPGRTIVVLGHGADTLARSIAWAGEERARNPDPERGLASTISTGLAALAGSDVDGAFIVLGDQPRLQADVLSALGDAADHDGPPIIVPRYDEPGPRNPVLLSRAAWPLADSLSGDRGLGSLIDARPDLVREVRVTGTMPDIDRPDDLAALLEGAP
jgi:molybdenum cofactor cytidylyltransferase